MDILDVSPTLLKNGNICAHFSGTYTKIEMIQKRLAWPLHKDDMQIHNSFHSFLLLYLLPEVVLHMLLKKNLEIPNVLSINNKV